MPWPRCWLVLVLFLGSQTLARADDWPQWLGPQRDGVWRETGIVEKFPPGGPKVRWRVPLGGGYSGPAVVGDRVYVTDRQLDKGAKNPDNPFAKTPVGGSERVLCLNEADGKVIWAHEYPCRYRISYPAGPRCTPVVDGDRVYTLGAMGDLFCLEAATGKVVWSKNFARDFKQKVMIDAREEVRDQEPPVWGWSGTPLVDGDKLICLVGGEGSVAVAFDKHTGKERWRALSAREPGYCTPMIYETGGKRQLIIWHAEAVNGLDPETGKVFWSQPFRLGAGMSIASPRLIKGGPFDRLFVSAFYNGPMMLKLNGGSTPTAELLWRGKSNSERRTDGLHAVMCTPVIKDGYIYGVCSYGQLRCLKADTGERVWETTKATDAEEGEKARWANAFIVAHECRYFLFTEKGNLVIAHLTPNGYEEIDRTKLVEPTQPVGGRMIVWTHPAFAHRCVYARNDLELVCVSLAK
jgi:outer membrane protein assembly factor BamB